MEDEMMKKCTSIYTGEKVNETNTAIATGEPSSTEAGFLTPVKVEVDIDDDTAAKDFQEILLTQEITEGDESRMRDGYVDECRKGVQMEVDHVHVMEYDLDEGAVSLFGGDKTPSMTASEFPKSPVYAEVENSSMNEEAEMSNEETVSSSSFASPNGFLNEKVDRTNGLGLVAENEISKAKARLETLQVNELEEQVKALHDLLILKEKEWNVILRLKKHTEYALEQAKYDQRLTKAQTEFNEKIPMTYDDKNTWMSLITTNKVDALKSAEQKIKESTENLKSRYNAMEKAFPLGSFTTSTPRSSRQDGDSIEIGGKKSLEATKKTEVHPERKLPVKPKLKPAPKLPASKSLESSPAAASQAQRMGGGGADLRPFLRTLRDIAANKNKLKSSTAFKPVRMTGADRRFRYQKVIEKLKVEANKLRKAANSSGNQTRPAVQQSARSKPSRQPTHRQQSASSGDRSVVVTFSTGERNLVTQQNYRQETAVPVPLCQGCHAAPSEYMCSICKDQWYCSRECQLKDWGEHSEVCS